MAHPRLLRRRFLSRASGGRCLPRRILLCSGGIDTSRELHSRSERLNSAGQTTHMQHAPSFITAANAVSERLEER